MAHLSLSIAFYVGRSSLSPSLHTPDDGRRRRHARRRKGARTLNRSLAAGARKEDRRGALVHCVHRGIHYMVGFARRVTVLPTGLSEVLEGVSTIR